MVNVQRATIELWMHVGGCKARKKRNGVCRKDNGMLDKENIIMK